EDPRLRRGLRRGPLDDRGSDRRGRACARDQRGVVRTLRVPAGRVVRREGDRGPSQPVRRSRGEGRSNGRGSHTGSAVTTLTHEPTPLLEGLRVRRRPDPCLLVIFGASGDLTAKKLMPAVYSLAFRRLLPENFGIVGAARTEEGDDEFRERMKRAVQEHARDPFKDEVWEQLESGMRYVTLDFADQGGAADLTRPLSVLDHERGTHGNRVYYFAVPPSAIGMLARKIAGWRDSEGWVRLVIEKPFGHGLTSARELNELLKESFEENEIFRIDHYLGKETVQNMLALRFAHGIFEPIWNRQFIDHVQVTVAESIGIAGRAGYYEQAGAVRDILRHH